VLAVSRCTGCAAEWFNEALRCERCGSTVLDPVEISPTGVVRAYTLIHSAARSPSPWGLAQVVTEGGVRLIGPTDEPLEVGDRAVVVRLDEGVPVFARAR
jgi:uncharacterized OB-fold protein